MLIVIFKMNNTENNEKNNIDELITKIYYFSTDNKETSNNLEILFSKKKVKSLLILILIIFLSIYFLNDFFKEEIILNLNDMILFSDVQDYNFSQYKTNIKAISLYYPKIHLLTEKNEILNNKSIIEKINNDINLAKSHGIYGFCIYYYCEPEKEIFNSPLDIIIDNKDLDINFFLTWNNEKNLTDKHILLINEQLKFLFNLKKYIYDERYIKIDGLPMIGIYNPKDIYDLKKTLSIWREKAKEFGIGELFIVAICNEKNNITELNEYQIFNVFVDLSPYNSSVYTNYNNTSYYFYSSIIDTNLNLNNIYKKGEYNVYRSSLLISKFPIQTNNLNLFRDYTPEKYYFLNKVIIDWTKNRFNESDRYIFINSYDNNYLGPHEKYGYASLNYLSRALFDLPLGDKNYNLINLEKNCLIAIQAHVFYTDLISEIINSINNIPVKFDLYITTNTIEKKIFIEDYVNKYSKANKYEVLIVENKGRDVYPLITQLKKVINNYKYFCHIHTKKSFHFSELGDNWRKYLYGNLLGNKDIISEILSNFENIEKLGIIFPETFPYQLKYILNENKNNIKNTNKLLNKIFPDSAYNIGSQFEFPVGNMFWARTKAVHQIFEYPLENKCPREKGQYDGTIMHAVERIWLFIAKLNGYYYKKTLRYIYEKIYSNYSK